MLEIIRRIFFVPAASAAGRGVWIDSVEAMAAAAASARQRLEDQGILQVELDAQAEIKERVRDARMSRDRVGGTHTGQEPDRAREAA